MNKRILVIIIFVVAVVLIFVYKNFLNQPVLNDSLVDKEVPAATVETFEQVFAHKLPVLAELGAEWCAPCKQMKPALQQIAATYSGKLIVDQVNVDIETEKVQAYGKYVQLRVIPVQLLIAADGSLLWQHEGYIPETELRRIISEKAGLN